MKQKVKRGRPRKNPLPPEPPKKKGRPRKVRPPQVVHQVNPEDNKLLNKFIKKALLLHQIESKFQCLEQMETLKRYIWDSYRYG